MATTTDIRPTTAKLSHVKAASSPKTTADVRATTTKSSLVRVASSPKTTIDMRATRTHFRVASSSKTTTGIRATTAEGSHVKVDSSPKTTTDIRATTAKGSHLKVASTPKTNMLSNLSSKTVTKVDAYSPLNFDAFVPQICLDWAVPQIVVVFRKQQEKYTSVITTRKPKSSKYRVTKKFNKPSEQMDQDHSVDKISGSAVNTTSKSEKSIGFVQEDTIPILAYYNELAELVQVTLVKCPFKIHRRIIRAISYCLPFHNFLTKLTISKGALTREILYELGEMLPRSNLTEICLDGSNVPNAKYHILLDHLSQLRYLSLCRCSIDDFECIQIATRMETGDNLQILDLSSNFITDLGAQSLGKMLTKNRQLRHLNLGGNEVTDEGASYLLGTLMEFPLSELDVIQKRCRRLRFIERRVKVYERCLQEVFARRQKHFDLSNSTSKGRQHSVASVKGKASKKTVSPEDNASEIAAEIMANEIVGGDFIDVFDKDHVVIKDGIVFCTGNFTLCSLNLAYNKLNYCSLQHILKVLEYQAIMKKPVDSTGLLRLVIEGNNLPIKCVELDMVKFYLRKAILDRCGSMEVGAHKKRLSFSSRRAN